MNKQPARLTQTPITLEDLQRDPDAALRAIYRTYQAEFIGLTAKYSRLDREQLADVFQDAAIILIQNVRSGKLSELTSSLKTYLFGIGKKLLLKRHATPVRETFLPEINESHVNGIDPTVHQAMELNETGQFLQKALHQLGPVCNRLLTLTFYDGLRSAAIADEMGYSDETVVRVQRLRCIRRLRELVKGKL